MALVTVLYFESPDDILPQIVCVYVVQVLMLRASCLLGLASSVELVLRRVTNVCLIIADHPPPSIIPPAATLDCLFPISFPADLHLCFGAEVC